MAEKIRREELEGLFPSEFCWVRFAELALHASAGNVLTAAAQNLPRKFLLFSTLKSYLCVCFFESK